MDPYQRGAHVEPQLAELKFPCSHCHQPVSAEMRICAFCGAENAPPTLRSEGLCPKCRIALDYVEYRDTPINPCPQCSGIWLENANFEWLTSEREVYADPSIPHQYRREPLPAQAPYVPCPCCDDFMVRINFKRMSGIMVDFCRQHGVWLDAGELEQIRCFIANGGIEKATLNELREVRGELQTLAIDFHQAEFTRRALQKPSFKAWFFS